MARRYISARNSAFYRQGGLCYYCEFPMWLTDLPAFAAVHGLTLSQAARLQATGEHLVSQQQGGGHGTNVVAACHHCNQSRHKFRPDAAPDPQTYRARVQSRVKHQQWHPRALFRVLR